MSKQRGRSNKLVGQAGEFLVCGELSRRGLIATPFAGNVPDFDVIATDGSLRSVPIQVKAAAAGGNWHAKADEWLDIHFDEATGVQTINGPSSIPHPDLIYVYVWIHTEDRSADRFFILTKAEVQRIVSDDYAAYLKRQNGVRPRNAKSLHMAIRAAQLAAFEDRWNLISSRLASAT